MFVVLFRINRPGYLFFGSSHYGKINYLNKRMENGVDGLLSS
jgi:hypothetical protein